VSRISSETLFNFTDSYDYLIDNLENGFYCSDTYEKFPIRNKGYTIPMVCFCDIPLSLIKDHFDWYGRYGIGIKRSYARQCGVRPVWYVTSENNIIRYICDDESITNHEKKYLVPYIKRFLGLQYHPIEKVEKRKKFYDEHEWRYIPEKANISFKDEKINRKQRMEIDLNEIEYIIIDTDDDINKILKDLKGISITKKVRFEYLVSKIITSVKIEKDF